MADLDLLARWIRMKTDRGMALMSSVGRSSAGCRRIEMIYDDENINGHHPLIHPSINSQGQPSRIFLNWDSASPTHVCCYVCACYVCLVLPEFVLQDAPVHHSVKLETAFAREAEQIVQLSCYRLDLSR